MKPDKQEIREKIADKIDDSLIIAGINTKKVRDELVDQIISLFPPRLSEEEIFDIIDMLPSINFLKGFVSKNTLSIENLIKEISHSLAGRIEYKEPIFISHYTDKIKHFSNCECPMCKPIARECEHEFRKEGVYGSYYCLKCGIPISNKEINLEPPKPQIEIEEIPVAYLLPFGNQESNECIFQIKNKINELVRIINQIRK